MSTRAATHPQAAPLGGRITTRTFWVSSSSWPIAFLLLAWRFAFGLGGTTALNDGYPWGHLDRLGRGGRRGAVDGRLRDGAAGLRPEPRPLPPAGPLGAPDERPRLHPGRLQRGDRPGPVVEHVEAPVSAAALELRVGAAGGGALHHALHRWCSGSSSRRRSSSGRSGTAAPCSARFADADPAPLERALPFVIALGVLLPTMHQSSLGSLMLLAGHKLNPLWQTPLLPLLFLLSCIAMGYAAVVMESQLTERAFFRLPSRAAAAAGRATGWLLLALRRQCACGVRRRLAPDSSARAVALDGTACSSSPRSRWRRAGRDALPAAAPRADALPCRDARGPRRRALPLSAFLIAFHPGPGWSYFPSVGELLITVGHHRRRGRQLPGAGQAPADPGRREPAT